MRAACELRDGTLISVLAYAGLRPGEALALRWKHVGQRTISVYASKTGRRRSVRLLGPLREDLAAWREALPATADSLVFPGWHGEPWSREAYASWSSRAPCGRSARTASRRGRRLRTGGESGGRARPDAVLVAALVLL